MGDIPDTGILLDMKIELHPPVILGRAVSQRILAEWKPSAAVWGYRAHGLRALFTKWRGRVCSSSSAERGEGLVGGKQMLKGQVISVPKVRRLVHRWDIGQRCSNGIGQRVPSLWTSRCA
jgi:hypothetical protein